MILLDCDGVLADFVSAAIEAHQLGITHDEWTRWDYHADQVGEQEFWRPLRGYFFWLGIRPYPGAREFYQRLRELDDVIIVTAPSRDSECASGKLDWIQHNIGVEVDDVVVCKRKELLARPGNLLIDDNINNTILFSAAGGTSLLYPQPWNFHTNWRDNQLVLRAVKECLRS